MIAAPARHDARILRQERAAGVSERAVPRDRLLKPRFRFPPIALRDAETSLHRARALAEARYAGGGYWATPNERRTSVSSIAWFVLGYLCAYHWTGEGSCRRRAEEGVEYILGQQREDGCFPLLDHSERGLTGVQECLYETGVAGRALVEAYRLTDDRRLLDASRRAVEWESACPISPSAAQNMTAVWHMAGHYAVTFDRPVLDAIVDRARFGALRSQLPSGGWPGSDSWMWRHGEIALALAEIMTALPDSEPFREEVRNPLAAALNRAIREQMASGEVPPNPRTKRAGYACSSILLALLFARRLFGDELDDCIRGIMHYRLSHTPDDAFLNSYADAWADYRSGVEEANSAATDQPVWAASFMRFVRDVDWGELVPEVINCWRPDSPLDSRHQQLRKATSDRTGAGAQEIVSRGARLRGGFGWRIPDGRLVPGRRYRFTAWVKCGGAAEKLPVVACSAGGGKGHPQWDAFTDCEFTQEDAALDRWSPVSVSFTATGEGDHVYVWGWGDDLGPDQLVSLAVDEARVVDDGLPLPVWNASLDRYDDVSIAFFAAAGAYLLEAGTLQ